MMAVVTLHERCRDVLGEVSYEKSQYRSHSLFIVRPGSKFAINTTEVALTTPMRKNCQGTPRAELNPVSVVLSSIEVEEAVVVWPFYF